MNIYSQFNVPSSLKCLFLQRKMKKKIFMGKKSQVGVTKILFWAQLMTKKWKKLAVLRAQHPIFSFISHLPSFFERQSQIKGFYFFSIMGFLRTRGYNDLFFPIDFCISSQDFKITTLSIESLLRMNKHSTVIK